MAISNIMLQAGGSPLIDALDSISGNVGVELFEEEIDDVIFQTNEFLTDATFTGDNGPFWWILQMSMCLAALFAIIMAAGMAYKMMVKGEVFDPLKIVRVLGVALVMTLWYGDFSVLDGLAYIPNAIGSYTHDLYEAEAAQVQDRLADLTQLITKRDSLVMNVEAIANTAVDATQKNPELVDVAAEGFGVDAKLQQDKEAQLLKLRAAYCGGTIAIDKLLMFLALLLFRIGWWGCIYCQQILLGMLTIFGPIQWAFSLLPKWEGAWAKWITRYLTVHFYGAMLYFVGFYVLLLFDIVLNIQYENLQVIVEEGGITNYLSNTIMTSGYLMVASIVALKCLNLVPDLAAWMIPEGDTAFSTRNFGEGVADGFRLKVNSIIK